MKSVSPNEQKCPFFFNVFYSRFGKIYWEFFAKNISFACK